jgi:hypothetical protein
MAQMKLPIKCLQDSRKNWSVDDFLMIEGYVICMIRSKTLLPHTYNIHERIQEGCMLAITSIPRGTNETEVAMLLLKYILPSFFSFLQVYNQEGSHICFAQLSLYIIY